MDREIKTQGARYLGILREESHTKGILAANHWVDFLDRDMVMAIMTMITVKALTKSARWRTKMERKPLSKKEFTGIADRVMIQKVAIHTEGVTGTVTKMMVIQFGKMVTGLTKVDAVDGTMDGLVEVAQEGDRERMETITTMTTITVTMTLAMKASLEKGMMGMDDDTEDTTGDRATKWGMMAVWKAMGEVTVMAIH